MEVFRSLTTSTIWRGHALAAGRVGVTSLLAIDTGFYGALENCIASAQRLHQGRRIDMQTLDEIRLISLR